jgi:hypothetical protein
MPFDSYTDDELALIIRRAAALQAADETDRHSLEDIQEIATQVGIPAELVAQVAAELPRGAPPGSITRMLFGPRASRVASGTAAHRATPTGYPDLLAALRRATGHMGRGP